MDERETKRPETTIDGFVDGFDGRTVSGWARDHTDPGRRLQIEVCIGDDVLTVLADQERSDVVAAGKAEGPCGFVTELYLDISNPVPIRIREASTGVELPGSPIDPARKPSSCGMSIGEVDGHIDYIDGNRIVGWAHDKALPGRSVQVEITVGDRRAVVLADGFRADVAAAGVNDGRCGFAFNFDASAAVGRLIRVRDASTGVEFRGSPFRPDILSRLAGPNHGEAMTVLRAEALLAWDEVDRAFASRVEGTHPHPGSKWERLLQPAFPDEDPECLVTRYVAFELLRSERRDLKPNGTLVERLRVLHWYMTECNVYHGLPVPLSVEQLKFLNAPMPLLCIDDEISVAAHAFITSEFDPSLDLRDRAALRRALYWWCVERAPQIALRGELIAPAEARALTASDPTIPDPTGDFLLTGALRELCARDRNLARLNLRSDVDRAVLAASLALRSLRLPHLARLVPRDLARTLLHPESLDRSPLLDALMQLVFEAGEAEYLCGRVREVLSLKSAPDRPPSGAGRPFLRDPRFADGLDPGVAVIGPTRATSGLGQAARLSVKILACAGRSPVQLDFFPGNPAPVGFADHSKAASLRVPRRINLLHLNAEAVPHAFALLDGRLTERSYNIGYVFWELNTVPECHRLAFDLLDEIWVSSEYNRETYARVTDLPVHNVGMAVENTGDVPALDRAGLGLPADAFVFLASLDSFSYVERKNPLGVLDAFQAAFPIEARARVALLIKTQNRSRVIDPHQLASWKRIEDAASRDPRIVIIDRTLNYQSLIGLKRTCDAYVSLHRSEGFGFGCLEAMRLGLPVVATAYSGTADFCRPETAYLVDFDLVPVSPTDYLYVERGSRWADPSIASAAAAMRAVYEDPEVRRARAAAGLRCAIEEFGVEAIARRYAARLAEIEGAFEAG